MLYSKFISVAVAMLATSLSMAFGDDAIPIASVQRDTAVDYEKEIYPFLRANCISCHNRTTTKGELNLESIDLMLQGGQSGPAVLVGKGSESLLVRSAAHLDSPSMPPRENKVRASNLTSKQLGLLQLWIDQGAKVEQREERIFQWEPIPESIESIYATAITGDGQIAACSSGGKIFVYHIPTRQCIAQLVDHSLATIDQEKKTDLAHRDLIPSLAFSPDGIRLASGSHREIKIWQRVDHCETQETPAAESRLVKPASSADSKIASVDGSRAASIVSGTTVKLVDQGTGALIAELRGEHVTDSEAAAVGRRVDFLASETEYRRRELKRSEEDAKRLMERAKKIGEELAQTEKTLETKKVAHQAAVTAHRVVRKDVRGWYKKFRPRGSDYRLPNEADKKSRDTAEVSFASALQAMTEAEAEMKPLVEAVAHHQSELKLANEHVTKKSQAVVDARAALTNAEEFHQAAVQAAANAREAAKASERLVTAMTFSPDGIRLATTTDDGALHLWSAVDGTSLKTIAGKVRTPKPAQLIEWIEQTVSTTTIAMTAEDGSQVEHRVSEEWRLERTLGGTNSPMHDRVMALRFSPDGTLLAAGSGESSRSGELTLWRTCDGLIVKALPELHQDSIQSLSFSRDGQRLATGSCDKTMKVLSTENWNIEKSFEGHTSHVVSVAWRAEGRTLASGGADNVVKIWDFESGDRTRNIDGWDEEVTTVQFVGLTGNLLVSSGDKRVRLMNESGSEVRAFANCKEYMQSAVASESGSIVIGGGQDGVLRVWDGVSGNQIVSFWKTTVLKAE